MLNKYTELPYIPVMTTVSQDTDEMNFAVNFIWDHPIVCIMSALTLVSQDLKPPAENSWKLRILSPVEGEKGRSKFQDVGNLQLKKLHPGSLESKAPLMEQSSDSSAGPRQGRDLNPNSEGAGQTTEVRITQLVDVRVSVSGNAPDTGKCQWKEIPCSYE